jgi:hypothetical protein
LRRYPRGRRRASGRAPHSRPCFAPFLGA